MCLLSAGPEMLFSGMIADHSLISRQHRVKKNGSSQVYECEKNNARALTSSPSPSTSPRPPRKTLPVAAPNPEHLSDLKRLVLQN